ncbi:MAG: tetratricopeptide repeat protein [Chitinophagaceae bacterium]|nr:tetratricopeptide repeat protein [Chitinophagaceae bacterium]MCW5905347.1 tetratricopeptide repeat protein [Chitinophagaceae bacterium]
MKIFNLFVSLVIVSLMFIVGTGCQQSNKPTQEAKQGQELIDSLKTALKTVKTDTTKVNILNDLSEHAGWRINDNDASIDYAQQALDLATKANLKNGMARAHNNMANAFAQKYNTKEAFENYFTALELYKETGNKKWEGWICNNIAITYKDLADYPKSIEYYTFAKKLATEVGDQTSIAAISIDVAHIYIMLSNYPEALENYFVALKIYEETGNRSGIANVYIATGQIYLSQGDYPKTLNNLSIALKIYEEIGDKSGIAACYNGIGIVYKDQGNYHEALKNHFASLKINEEIGNKIGVSYAYNNIGEVYYKQGNYPEALKNYLASVEIKKKTGDKYGAAYTYNNLGFVYTQFKDYPQAQTSFQKALLLSKEIGNKENLKNGYSGMAILDSTTGNWQGAYQNYKHFTVYKDSMFNEENTKKFTQTSMQYEFDKKQLADSLQNVQVKKLAAEKLSKQKTYTTLGAALAFILLGFSFFIFRNNKKLDKEKKKSENLLLNILPTEVAEELKEKGSADAKQFDEVSVLFTDFVHFTQTSEQLSPQQLVQELNECFTAFDNIIEQNGLEKIKTIGDAYLAVCGLPNENEQHAKKTVQAALEIRDFIAKRKQTEKTFDIRIGIHSGSVVAGIVGVKKFAYDIWGDTVNTAARMESSGEAGKINISAKTYQLIKDDFEFEYRGKIDAKGKGEIDMYFVS